MLNYYHILLQLIPTSDVAFKQRHRTAEQTTQRWVETETATEKSADTSTVKYRHGLHLNT